MSEETHRQATNSEWWKKVEELYHTARELSVEERPRFLDTACKTDAAMRRQIEVLLRQTEKPGSFLNRPAVDALSDNRQPVLDAGIQLGSYRIEAPIGQGGMGVVYRARDTKLNRPVAIKFLSENLADADARRRFQREAQMASALDHPHILTVHDAGEFEGRQYLVTEFVDGGTLSDWAQAEPRTWRQVAELLIGVADGLAAAHGAGILHRDIKPANILVARNGYAKLADFGLAKLVETSQDDATRLTQWRTGAHILMGTIPYMSPEQASGKTIDVRSDIFSFGVVLYEILAQRKPFEGETGPQVIQAIIHQTPEPLPASVPLQLRMAVDKALEKDPADRYQSMRELVVDLRRLLRQPAPLKVDSPVVQTAAPRQVRLAWAALFVIGFAALVAAVVIVREWRLASPAPAASEMRLEITTPPTTDATSLAISPDGQKIVFAGTSEGQSRLWLRLLDSVSGSPLAGTDAAYYPFWSPDGQSIGFFADGKLKRMDIKTGSLQVLASATAGRGGAWNRHGVILFAPQAGPIFRISADGGEPVQLTQAESTGSHRFPQFLPDGRHFIFFASGNPQIRSGIYAGQLDATEPRRLLDADVAAIYLHPGKLVFIRQGTLFAQDFDADQLALSGNPVPIAEQVAFRSGFYSAAISASATGILAYRSGPAERRQFIWFDRSGREISKVGNLDSADASAPSMSPDGRYIALDRTMDTNRDIWLLETARGVLRRLTFDMAEDNSPIWSPDGSRIVFTSRRQGVGALYQMPGNGNGNEKLLLETPQPGRASDWSADGRFILFRTQDARTKFDLWALPMDGGGKPFLLVKTNFDERDAQFSPDGKWIAYESDESGRFEIYVQPFPGPGPKLPVSTNGGAQVRWPRSGKELFYIGLDDRLMAVPIRLPSNSQAIEIGAPVPLFPTRVVGGAVNVQKQQYVVSPDRKKFLINTVPEEAASSRITVILNLKSR
jgi:Tol biopolymer transport system component/tRNA A-37 threonylcarbamoyl transferase component Bud32